MRIRGACTGEGIWLTGLRRRRPATTLSPRANDGPGAPDDRRESIFEPESGDTHGFGLHLVRTLAEGDGGSVRVEDNEPSGAAFVVSLPRADPPGGIADEGTATAGAAVR